MIVLIIFRTSFCSILIVGILLLKIGEAAKVQIFSSSFSSLFKHINCIKWASTIIHINNNAKSFLMFFLMQSQNTFPLIPPWIDHQQLQSIKNEQYLIQIKHSSTNRDIHIFIRIRILAIIIQFSSFCMFIINICDTSSYNVHYFFFSFFLLQK